MVKLARSIPTLALFDQLNRNEGSMVFDFRCAQIRLLPRGCAKPEMFADAYRSLFTRSIDKQQFAQLCRKSAADQIEFNSIFQLLLIWEDSAIWLREIFSPLINPSVGGKAGIWGIVHHFASHFFSKPTSLRKTFRACLKIARGAAARDFGCGQGGELRAGAAPPHPQSVL
jgi:hypothetical protein